MTVKITSSRGQRVGQVEGISLENTDNCLNEFHYEELERVRAMPGEGKHLSKDSSGLGGYVCIVHAQWERPRTLKI